MSLSVNLTPDPNQMGGWSFLQTLTAPNNNADKNDVVYVHPLAKRSKSALTERSLKMCTEILGSETGSDDVATGAFMTPLPEPVRSFRAELRARVEPASGPMLPPPIPSMSGRVPVERVREGGRLVITAVTVGPSHNCLEAQRVNGHLTLRLMDGCALRCDAQDPHHDSGCGGAEDMAAIFHDDVEGCNSKYPRASTSRCNEEGTGNRELMAYPKPFSVATT